MNKTAFAIMVTFTLLFSGAQLVEMAEANAYWIYDHVDPVPGTIPPSITIYNPKNYTSYSTNSIPVNILVNKAKLAGWGCNIEWVGYSIDGKNNVQLYTLWQYHEQSEEVHPITIPSDINFNLPSLASGKHTLTVTANVAVLGGDMQVFFLDCSSIVYFTVDNTVSSPSPSPTPSPTPTPPPTPTPEPTPYEETGVQNTSQDMVTGGAIAVASIVVFLGLLFYFIRRK